MKHEAVDPAKHPVDQYKSMWPDVVQYIALLYVFSKFDHYEKAGQTAAFERYMLRYRNLEEYSTAFELMVEALVGTKELGEIMGLMGAAHNSIRSRNYKPLLMRRIFTLLRDDIHLIHFGKIRVVLHPIATYFRKGSVPNKDLEIQILESLKVLRNPRIRRILSMIIVDLDSMVAEAPPVDVWKKTENEIVGMSKSDRLNLVKNTTDSETLQTLLKVAEGGDRSVLGALFHRGYIKGMAPTLYAENRLVTIGNFKKLDESILTMYVGHMMKLTDSFYAWWSSKFSSTSSWGHLWEELVPGREDFTLKMVRKPGVFIGDAVLYRQAADSMPLSLWNQQDILKIWKHATDPSILIHAIDKKARLVMFPKLSRGWAGNGSEDIWLYDCTRSEVEPFYKLGLLSSKKFLNDLFGDPWGDITYRSSLERWEDIPPYQSQKFFSTLTNRDVQLLNDSPLMESFRKAVISHDVSDRYAGGLEAYISDLWNLSPPHVRIWFVSILPERILKNLIEAEADSALFEKYINMSAEQYTKQKARAEAYLRDNGGIQNLKGRSILSYLKLLTPGEAVDAYISMRKSNINSYSEISEDYLFKICPNNRVAIFLKWLTPYYMSNSIAKHLIPYLSPSDAPQLLGSENILIREWLASNIKPEDVLDACDKHMWLLEYLCNIVGDFPQDHLEPLAQKLDRSVLNSIIKRNNLVCLVLQMKDPSAYAKYPISEVRVAAMGEMDADTAEQRIRDSNDPLITHMFERDDFPQNAPRFLSAFFANRKIDSHSIDYDWDFDAGWQKALDGFDKAVGRMSHSEFVASLEVLQKLDANDDTARYRVFGKNSLWKVVMEGVPPDLLPLFVWDRSKSGPHIRSFDFSNYSYSELVRNVPFDPLFEKVLKGDGDAGLNNTFYGLVLVSYATYPEWYTTLSNERLKQVSGHANKLYLGNFVARQSIKLELKTRTEASNAILKGNTKTSLQVALSEGDHRAYAATIVEVFDNTKDVGFDLIQGLLKKQDVALGFRAGVIGRLPTRILDKMWSVGGATKLGVAQFASNTYFTERFPKVIKEFTINNKDMNDYYKRDTRLKSAMIKRALPEQALEMFIYYYKVQGQFGPKVRQVFLEKTEDLEFKKLLVEYLRSKKFNIRKKNFTLAMVPLVLKLDDAEVTDKFNRSSRFRAKRIGSAVDHWDTLLTDADKAKWLDDISDKGFMERLLRSLVERTISLRAPMDEEFTIGTNNPTAIAPLMSKIQLTSRIITHGAIFNLSVERASEADIRGWLLGNPLEVFNITRAPSDIEYQVRLDEVPKEESDRVSKVLTDRWKGARRNISPEVKAVYKVTNPNQEKWKVRKNPSTNVKTLFHGTHFFVAGLIIQNHFKVMKSAKAGRMMGDGIYFTDVGSKCAQYITTSAPSQTTGEGVILICEVDLGNMLELNANNDRLRRNDWQAAGYDSIYWPKRGSSGYGGRDSEYAVADVSRIRVTHAIYLKRVSDYNY